MERAVEVLHVEGEALEDGRERGRERKRPQRLRILSPSCFSTALSFSTSSSRVGTFKKPKTGALGPRARRAGRREPGHALGRPDPFEDREQRKRKKKAFFSLLSFASCSLDLDPLLLFSTSASLLSPHSPNPPKKSNLSRAASSASGPTGSVKDSSSALSRNPFPLGKTSPSSPRDRAGPPRRSLAPSSS